MYFVQQFFTQITDLIVGRYFEGKIHNNISESWLYSHLGNKSNEMLIKNSFDLENKTILNYWQKKAETCTVIKGNTQSGEIEITIYLNKFGKIVQISFYGNTEDIKVKLFAEIVEQISKRLMTLKSNN